MNGRCLIAVVAVALFTAGCAYSVNVTSDYDRAISFTKYRTFSLRQGNSSGNALMDQRIRAAVEGALVAKGWTAAPDGEGDATVVTNTATENKQSIRTFYDGWGGWRWRWGGGTASTVVEDYQVGTLVVDIFDARTKQAIWRGSCSGVVPRDPHPDGSKVQEAVMKMFNGFPPAD